MENDETEMTLTENQRRNTEIFYEYTLWRSTHKAKSKETQIADYTNVMQFLRWYGDRPILEVKKHDIRQYILYLSTHQYQRKPAKGCEPKPLKGYAETTQYEKKKCIKVFLRWLHEDYEITDISGEITLETPKTERDIQKPLTYADALILVNVCENLRDRAMIHFLLDSGVRRAELLDIRYGGVKFTANGVEVSVPPKKGAKEGRRVFCVHCVKDMKLWYDNHPIKTPDSYFFCGAYKPHRKFSTQGLATQLKRVAARAGFSENVYPHLFRHSSATIFTQFEGMNAFKINKRYGWRLTSRMAEHYAHHTGKESDEDIMHAFGKPIIKKKPDSVDVLLCPNCHEMNNVGDDRCYKCNKALSKEEIANDEVREKKRIEEIIKAAKEPETKQMQEILEKYNKLQAQMDRIINQMVPEGFEGNSEKMKRKLETSAYARKKRITSTKK